MLNAGKMLRWKKRNVVVICLTFGVFFLMARYVALNLQEKPWSFGVLILPGNGNLSHEFTMPVNGAFQVLLQPVVDGSIDKVPGMSFDRSTCRPFGPFNSAVTCDLFGRFGVVRLELRDADTNDLIRTRYSPNMYRIPLKEGAAIADFRRFSKGTKLALDITSYLSESLVERARIPYQVIIQPIRVRCFMLGPEVVENPVACDTGW